MYLSLINYVNTPSSYAVFGYFHENITKKNFILTSCTNSEVSHVGFFMYMNWKSCDGISIY